MRIFCLGGAGRIAREAVLDSVQFSGAEQITVADVNESAGREVVAWLNDPRVRFVRLDVRDRAGTVQAMRGHDVVMDGTTIGLNGLSTACIAEAGCHGINLNGFGEEEACDPVFRACGKACVPGFGMTPGTTQMMAMHAAAQLDTVATVRVSHGAYRPIAFSAASTETTVYEYDPKLPGRVVFEDGEFKQVPPFARPREIALPEPYGTSTQYIIPHAETRTLAKNLAGKGVRLIEVRGTWPRPNMQLIRALHDWGFLRNDRIPVCGVELGIMEAIGAYLTQAPEGRQTDLYGYALHVEVEGSRGGAQRRHTLWHTHPASDGSPVVCPPLLRRQSFELEVRAGDYLLVYLLNHGYAAAIRRWHTLHPHVPVHCFYDRPGAPAEERVEPGLTFHALHGEKFLRMMAGARAVVCTAGFESVCEAAYLGKPLLLIPVENHVEQFLNACDAEQAGLGWRDHDFRLSRLLVPGVRGAPPEFRRWVNRAEQIAMHTVERAAGWRPAIPAPAATPMEREASEAPA